MRDQEITLLMDGDILAYRIASAVQKVEEDDFGYLRPFASVVEGQAALDNLILGLINGLKATHIRMVLSDPHSNWRLELLPSYKGNRDDLQRPLLLGRLKEYLQEKYGAIYIPSLEADDALGIMATEPVEYGGKRIVVGHDKDFKSIPGLHHTLGDRTPMGEYAVREIGRKQADHFHLMQTLAGDRIDGYEGCPGIGMERAARILEEPKRLVPEKGIVTRGPRKGQETVKWMSEPTDDVWACIVSNYQKAGKTEADALLTARIARILRAEDYDREKDRIILWTPDKLRG